MFYAIIKKEFLKTKISLAIIFALTIAMTIYAIMRFQLVIRVKGMEQLWLFVLYKDVVFIEAIRFVPLVLGTWLAFAQWLPEVQAKRLKLTLHLPVSNNMAILTMTWFSIIYMIIIFGISLLVIVMYLSAIMPPELVRHIMLTTLPWFLTPFVLYIAITTAIIEPGMAKKILFGLIGVGLAHICHIAGTVNSFTTLMTILCVITLAMSFMPLLAVENFKTGK